VGFLFRGPARPRSKSNNLLPARLKTRFAENKTIHPGNSRRLRNPFCLDSRLRLRFTCSLPEDISDVKAPVQRHQSQVECTEQPTPYRRRSHFVSRVILGTPLRSWLTIASPKADSRRRSTSAHEGFNRPSMRRGAARENPREPGPPAHHCLLLSSISFLEQGTILGRRATF